MVHIAKDSLNRLIFIKESFYIRILREIVIWYLYEDDDMKKLIYIIPVLTLIYAIVMWFILPDIVPTHFGISGNVDAYGSKNLLFVIPFVSFAFIILSKTELQKNQMMYVFSMSLLFYVEIIMGLSMKKPDLDIIALFFVGFGIIMILIGIILPSSETSIIVGIRTKWTLRSKEVWERTHLFARIIFIVAGVLVILSSLLLKGSIRFTVSFVIAIIAVLIPAVYSYFISEK